MRSHWPVLTPARRSVGQVAEKLVGKNLSIRLRPCRFTSDLTVGEMVRGMVQAYKT